MATHTPIGHKSQQHSGKYEDQSKLEHNRMNVGTPATKATKVANPVKGAAPTNVKGD